MDDEALFNVSLPPEVKSKGNFPPVHPPPGIGVVRRNSLDSGRFDANIGPCHSQARVVTVAMSDRREV